MGTGGIRGVEAVGGCVGVGPVGDVGGGLVLGGFVSGEKDL